jgi:hypothetical protein
LEAAAARIGRSGGQAAVLKSAASKRMADRPTARRSAKGQNSIIGSRHRAFARKRAGQLGKQVLGRDACARSFGRGLWARSLGATMTRLFPALAAAFAGSLCGAPAVAQTQLSESPITPGFWSFPTKKTGAAADIVTVCRNHFEIRFADGHFIGLRMQKRDLGLTQREVEKVGRCTFNRDAQTDGCEVKFIHADGSILAGTAQIKYSLDGQKIQKMVVTPKMVTDSPIDNAPFDAFPVRCPDDAVWNILNETSAPK